MSCCQQQLEKTIGRPFYNLSKLDLPKLLADPHQLAPNLNFYINGFSRNVREIMERFSPAAAILGMLLLMIEPIHALGHGFPFAEPPRIREPAALGFAV